MAEFVEVMNKIKDICHSNEDCDICPYYKLENCLCSNYSIIELLEIEKIAMNYDPNEVKWTKVPVDTKILVKHYDKDSWQKRHFAKYENGAVYAFYGGETSWSHDRDPSRWEYAKLYVEGDEI